MSKLKSQGLVCSGQTLGYLFIYLYLEFPLIFIFIFLKEKGKKERNFYVIKSSIIVNFFKICTILKINYRENE